LRPGRRGDGGEEQYPHQQAAQQQKDVLAPIAARTIGLLPLKHIIPPFEVVSQAVKSAFNTIERE
jgi:hypothetical protein